jgi:hypothetical protein
MGRFGASVMDVAYDKLLDRWLWLQPYGVTEHIAEPPQIFVDELWARQHTLETPRAKPEKPTRIRRGKAAQLVLEL